MKRILFGLALMITISVMAPAAKAQSDNEINAQPSNVINTVEVLKRLNSEKTNLVTDSVEPKTGGPVQGSSSGPTYQVTPYVWFSSFKGDVGTENVIAHANARFVDIFDELNFGAMVGFEARWDRWRLLTDVVYMNLSDDKATPGPLFEGAQITSKTFILGQAVGYRIIGNRDASIDAIGGIRYWHLSNRLELRRGNLRPTFQSTSNWVDVVGGLRAKAPITPRIFLSGLADVGGGGADLTFQLFGVVGFNFTEHFTGVFGYRHLDVDYRRNGKVFDVAFSGLVAGFGYRF